MQEILINNALHESRVAVMEDGVIQELRIERNAEASLVGNIYLGIVDKVLPGHAVSVRGNRPSASRLSSCRRSASVTSASGGNIPIRNAS